MSLRGSAQPACLLCQHRGNPFWRKISLSSPWQISSRSIATAKLRRKPSRMTLSREVADTDGNRERRGRTERGPWANLNQTEARHRSAPRPRSQAQIKRSSRGREDGAEEKKESPLYKALKMQTTLAPMQYGLRNAIKERIASIMNFDQFRLLPAVQESILTQALPDLVDVSPTPIQRIAIPALLETENTKKTAKHKQKEDEPAYKQFLLAAETGSGKTLAYLVPVVDAVKRADLVDKEEAERKEKARTEEQEKKAKARIFQVEAPELSENLTTSAGRPRAIILVPTSELVAQVTAKVKAFAHTVKLRSGGISSTESPRKIRSIVFNPNGIDVLVSTPHLLSSIAKSDPYVLSRVSHIVVDEADSLLDRSFAPITLEIVEKAASSLKQLILCSATIPRSLDSLLHKKYPDVRRLATPSLHAVPRRVQLGVVDIEKDPYRGNRSLACADVIWSLGKAGDGEPGTPYDQYTGPKDRKIIVFVNEREEATEVANFLKAKGIDAVSFSRDSAERQAEILADFTDPPTVPDPADIVLSQRQRRLEDSAIPFVMPGEPAQPKPSRKLANTKVLVMTDLGSRGIDTLPVKTVILYDVPHTTIDFIHRLGRVGRMGKRGRGIVLVGKKDRKDVVREVREAMFRGQALI